MPRRPISLHASVPGRSGLTGRDDISGIGVTHRSRGANYGAVGDARAHPMAIAVRSVNDTRRRDFRALYAHGANTDVAA